MGGVTPAAPPQAATRTVLYARLRLTFVEATPLASVTVLGVTGWPLPVTSAMLLLKLGTVLPKASFAVIVTPKPTPAVAVAGAVTANVTMAFGLTATVELPLKPLRLA